MRSGTMLALSLSVCSGHPGSDVSSLVLVCLGLPYGYTMVLLPVGTLEDGHCLRRALGKLWDMQPGQVIRKIKERGEHLRLHRG